ncbi:MAG: T9SS type A sorting domain-containing protein [Lentimicrobiaceae bacterium]|nr:T9SS type A sorting domain-containing protein [Lentimicrobiaceae bacterium]
MNKTHTLYCILLSAFCFLLSTSIFAQSPFIYKVFDYRPAPGQFINKLPKYETGDTQEDMNRKAEESISGENKILISLGGYGGYVIFGFDHPVVNIIGSYDFKILGNALISTPSGAPRDGGSCEPGIVMVSYDTNGNGFPDDEWYELAGSEYSKPETIKNYQITYYKSQSNYPQWIEDETLFFEGTKLADNGVDINGTGTNYFLYAYPWGYADNYPNNDERSNFNIEWAVDKNGNSVHLPAIHFVKAYTGVNQYCGWLGEISTEVMGAEDLHPLSIRQNETDKRLLLLGNPVKDQLIIVSEKMQNIDIYDYLGRKQMSLELQCGTNYIPCSQLSQGIYLLVVENISIKFIKQ